MTHAISINRHLLWRFCCAFVIVFFLALPGAELENNMAKAWVWRPGVLTINFQQPLSPGTTAPKAKSLDHNTGGHSAKPTNES